MMTSGGEHAVGGAGGVNAGHDGYAEMESVGGTECGRYPGVNRRHGFVAVLKAEVLKGRRAAPRKIALVAPLPFCVLGMVAGGVGGGGAIGAFATCGWNYWYALMLPIAVALITASVANSDARQKLRPVLGLPLSPASTWWAKTAYVLALVFGANLVVLVASIVTGLLGGNTPSAAAGLATAVLLVVGSAWMVPVGLALTTRFGTLVGIALPAVLQLGAGIALWSSSLWYLFPPAAMLCSVSPLMGVAPSGVPLEMGDPLGTFGGEAALGLALAAALFAVLSMLGARWYARRESA